MEVTRQILAELTQVAAQMHPEECCGILFGKGEMIETVLPAKNVHPNPRTHFEIDPISLIAAHKAERGGGPQIIGYYHSHPAGLAEPSATDAKMAARDGKIWAIIAGRDVKFWHDLPEGFAPLSYCEPSD